MFRSISILVLISLMAVTLIGCTPTSQASDPNGPDSGDEPSREPADSDEETQADAPEIEEEGPMSMALTSPAFNHGDPIPSKFSCDGEDISPELDWFGTPEGTVSLALIMDDPDAPVGTWVHWVVFNLPMDLSGLREGMTGVGLDGSNSWNRTGYGGPCPPSGTHRYFFKLYALDLALDLEAGADKAAILDAMAGHILGQAELMGTYTR